MEENETVEDFNQVSLQDTLELACPNHPRMVAEGRELAFFKKRVTTGALVRLGSLLVAPRFVRGPH